MVLQVDTLVAEALFLRRAWWLVPCETRSSKQGTHEQSDVIEDYRGYIESSYTCIYTCLYMYIHVYMYMEREDICKVQLTSLGTSATVPAHYLLGLVLDCQQGGQRDGVTFSIGPRGHGEHFRKHGLCVDSLSVQASFCVVRLMEFGTWPISLGSKYSSDTYFGV